MYFISHCSDLGPAIDATKETEDSLFEMVPRV